MMEKIKSNLTYVFCAGLGLLNFIFLAFNYVAVFAEYSYGGYGNYSQSYGVSGYKVMDLWEFKFSGVISSIIQIFILLLGIALLAWGVLGLLKAFGVFEKFPDKLGKFESKKLGEFGLFGLAGLNVLLLIFLIILTASNTEKSEYGSAGIKLSAGIFIALIFTIGAVVALKVLEKKFPATDSGETVTYVCSKCGKKARSSDNFCSACGGKIEKKVVVKEEYACEKCGKKATAKDKFCSACGGEIVVKQPLEQESEPQVTELEEPTIEEEQAEVAATEEQVETATCEETID